MYKNTIIVASLISISFGLMAQEVKTLTLKEAIELGYANSKQLAISNAKVKEAQAKLDQSKDAVIPNVGVSGNYFHLNTPTISFANPPSTDGGDSPLAAFSKLHDVGLVQLTAVMPLYNGLKLKNTRIMNQYLREAEQYNQQTTHAEVALNTIKAVYQYYELQESRKTIQENLKQEHQRLQEFKNQEQQGLLARNDRLKTELQANNVELALTEVNHSVELASYNLGILLGLPDNTQIDLDTTSMFNLVTAKTWDEYLQAGLTNRTELKAAALQVKASEAGYKISKSSRLPKLDLSAGYINAFIPNVANITNTLNAGLSLKYSITGAVHATHLMREARAKVDQATTAEADRVDQVKVQIREKYLKYLEMQDKLVINEKTINQAEENFQISQNKYNQGLLILSDYLDADVTLLRARINYATSRAEAMVSYYALQESIGTLQ
ncbi:MAG: TolC family protein [Chryseolinea sp.]